MEQLIKCALADLTPVTKSFSIRPVVCPTTSGKVIYTSDPIVALYSPQTLDVVPNVYDINCKQYTDNHWYIQTSGSSNLTASYNIVSGSVFTSSLSTVLFDFENIISNPTADITVTIQPVSKNIAWQDTLILNDVLEYVTDANGSFTASLVQTEYKVTYNGLTKHTPLFISVNGSYCTASAIIIAGAVNTNITVPKQTLSYGSIPFTGSIPFQSTSSTYFQTKYFGFSLCDGTPVTNDFSINLITGPLASGSIIISNDPLTIDGSVDLQPVCLASSIFKIELNKRASNDWYLSTDNTTNPTASACIVSGSYCTASYCKVLFALADFELSPLTNSKIEIAPVWTNVGFNQSFLLKDEISRVTDNNGCVTVTLAPQPYNVTLSGYGIKKTKLQIFPVLDCTASQVIVSGYNTNKIGGFPYHIPLPFSVDFTSSYAVNALNAINAIHSISASYITPDTKLYFGDTMLFAEDGLTMTGQVSIDIDGTLSSTNPITASLNGTASFANTASIALGVSYPYGRKIYWLSDGTKVIETNP